jgi:SAM-dependent methyltransferase
MGFQTYLGLHLPAVPARVLEVGCGRGELARAVARSGYDVVAIDPEAPEGDIFQAVSLEAFADPGPFDAIVASRALHHIADLPGALAKIASLLGPGGRLLLYEHAWDRLDEPTARWYLEHRGASGPDASPTLERCLADWREGHAGLHGYATMREELGRRFTERFFAWTPYLFGELRGRVTEQHEQSLIDAGTIQATGFCYVGERPR